MTLCIKMLPNVPQLFGTQNTGLIVLNVYWKLEKGGKKAGAFILLTSYANVDIALVTRCH